MVLFLVIVSLITEYADDGDLEQKINKIKTIGENFTEDDIWTAFTQIAKGLKALHANNIIHRDLKVYTNLITVR